MRFYENRLLRPLPIFILAIGLGILSPLQIPPQSPAVADEIEIIKPVLVERTPEAAKVYAKTQLSVYGWDNPNSWQCLISLWTRESNWRPDAYNKIAVWQDGEKLHAGGIPQILGLDPKLTVEEQIERGLRYIEHRYGGPCSAWRFWSSNFYY